MRPEPLAAGGPTIARPFRRPVRPLIVDLSARLGGASVRCVHLAQRLQARVPVALAGLAGRPVVAYARSCGVDVVELPTGKADPGIAWRLRRLAHARAFTLLDVQNPQSKLWGAAAAAPGGLSLVSTLNSWYLDEHKGGLRGRVYQRLERLSTPLTDMFIAVSAEIERRLAEAGVPPDRRALIPNAVAPDGDRSGTDGAMQRAALRSAFGLPAEAAVCVAVGRLVEAKGFDDLIESVALMSGGASCLIVGEGALRAPLERRIERLELAGRVKLIGFRPRDQVLRIVRAADVFVMPSHSEGTPVALLEAAALGTPIVASRVGGIPDLLAEGEQAVLVPPSEPRAIADAVDWILRHPAEGRRLAAAARRHVEAHHGLEAQAESTLDAYAAALDRAARRV